MVWGGGAASAEILAMMNYESKTPDQVKALKLTGAQERREGIAIIDVDPESATFGKWLVDIPLDPGGVSHHIFYDRTMTKAYLTSLASPALQVMDLTEFPYRLRTIEVPNCAMAEDVIFDDANEHWYLTCMMSANVWQGSVATDQITGEIKLPGTYPHGLGVNTDIDRIVVTSTIKGDLTEPGETVSIVRASTLEPLGEIKLSLKDTPSGEAPVEILAAPGGDTATFYVTNMFGATLWALSWNEAKQDFDASQVIDFNTMGAGVALEMYFNAAGDRLYVTTAVPGQLHIFDTSDGPLTPTLIKTLPAGEGAHHVAFTKDGKYAFVQNSLLNLPGMADGSITVIDLVKGEVVASMDTLKDAGFNPNVIVLLPEWNDFAGH
ncbi:MAG: YncE family protein [Proteobacteria bacterium]|nr:YncE family protein [Pseudomonadota bacterium]